MHFSNFLLFKILFYLSIFKLFNAEYGFQIQLIWGAFGVSPLASYINDQAKCFFH